MDVALDVAEQGHDSGHVTVLDRRLDRLIVGRAAGRRKWSFRTVSTRCSRLVEPGFRPGGDVERAVVIGVRTE
jgi:hypothetical protein